MIENTEVKEVTILALSVPDQANAIIINSNEDYARAGQLLLTIKGIRKKIEETFKPIKQKMDAAKKEVLDQEKAADAPLAKAEAIIKPRIAQWNTEQERIRKEEEDRQRAIAQAAEEERRLQEALLAEQAGNKEEAEAIIETPIQAAPVVIPKTTPKVAGISFTKQWKFRIVDESKIPRQYLSVDEQKIGAVVRALKDSTNIPGVEIYSVDNVSSRAA
jgi:hypothetical protein